MRPLNAPLLALAVLGLSGCAAIGGIFKAGAVTALIGVAALLLVIWLLAALLR